MVYIVRTRTRKINDRILTTNGIGTNDKMRFDELEIPQNVAEALTEKGFVNLHPPQAEAIPIALTGRNLVAAVPTASGKSLIGYIAALKTILEKGKKVLYIVPLKALASEKRDDLEGFSDLGFKVAMSSGDLDSDDRGLKDADVVVATSEKADSMIRHGSRWIQDVGLVIADEVHMIHDPSRGPTLEVTITKLMRKNPDIQIIALSATVSNSEDLAQWLDAELVRSEWRPVELHEGVYFNGEVTFEDGHSIDIDVGKDEVWSLVSDVIKKGGQSLVFVNARRSTESLAVKFSSDMKKLCNSSVSDEEAAMLEGDSESTAVGRKLAACVKCGVAFHNAGLTYKQRRFVEDRFKSGDIKCIIATPTLAAGINLPARRVIVRDTKRFESNSGNTPISVMEVKQMCGRAGRPGYDPYGEAILVAKNYPDYEHLMDDYVMHDTERLTSKLGKESTLRNHILGLIASGDAESEDGIVGFLHDTFFGCVSQLYGIESVVENVVEFLVNEGMVERDGDRIRPLAFGKRVSDLYIDPMSAVILRDAVNKIKDETDEFLILHAVASTPDVLGLYPKKSDEGRLGAIAEMYDGQFLSEPPDSSDYAYEYFFQDLKVAALAMDWIAEIDEEAITNEMGIGPGDIRARIDMLDWILYGMSEIAYIFRPEVVKRIKPLLVRVRYGVKAELMELVSFRGVGRARARILYNAGIRTKSDIIDVDVNKLANLPRIGYVLAKRLKEQVGGNRNESEGYVPPSDDIDDMLDKMAGENEKVTAPTPDVPKQSKLFDF